MPPLLIYMSSHFDVSLAYQIDKYEGNWDERICLGVMKFASGILTKRWLESDHQFKQPDFLGQVDIIIVPLRKKDMSHKGEHCISIRVYLKLILSNQC